MDAQQRDVESQQHEVDEQQREAEAASKPAPKAKAKPAATPDLSELRMLIGTMAQHMIQSDQRQEKTLSTLIKAVTAPKRRKIVRDPVTGRPVGMEEEMVS